MRALNEYPIIDNKELSPQLTACKITMVSYIASNTARVPFEDAATLLCDAHRIPITNLPNLVTACSISGVRLEFLNDYNSIQYMIENDPAVSKLHRMLAHYVM